MVKDVFEAQQQFKIPPLSGSLQLKGTDICMDFHCECGTHNHYDGCFMEEIICKGCRRTFALSTYLELIEVEEANSPTEDES